MEQYNHTDYDFYRHVQRKLTWRKTQRATVVRSWIDESDMKEVNDKLHLYSKGFRTVVCHGCRSGLEVDVLKRLNPNSEIWGTDIYDGYMFDRKWFREMDFDVVPPEWEGYFDIIYSNSIDHSRDPISTLSAWKRELKTEGIMFVNFHWGRGVSREDCFHLDRVAWKDELKQISMKVGLHVLLIASPRGFADGAWATDVIMRKA